MIKRPGGHGESSLIEKNKAYKKYKSNKPYIKAGLICLPFLILGLLPIFYPTLSNWLGLQNDVTMKEIGLGMFGGGNFLHYIDGKGPFGIGALILSLLVPFSITMFFALSYSMKTKQLIKTRQDSKELEKEFNNSLFTLGNRLGDGTPAELAFIKVAQSTKGQKTEKFFKIVNTNLQSMGMGIESAIFDENRGAIIYYPSKLIQMSMKILIESAKKGLKVAAQSLMSISEYVRNIQKINERLKDLLADVISDMKSNMNFLAPLLAGIVIGLASMITGILSQLKNLITQPGGAETMIAGLGSAGTITEIFDIVKMIPPYYLQISISIYIIQIIFILTGTLVVVDAGEDKLKKTNETGKNLIKGGMLYIITALISIITLSLLAGVAFSGLVR